MLKKISAIAAAALLLTLMNAVKPAMAGDVNLACGDAGCTFEPFDGGYSVTFGETGVSIYIDETGHVYYA